ncbi:hypothetical protein A2U01_0093645, partial [Trifolium medium]|nr:hypothetical protein [Trifolium medium]
MADLAVPPCPFDGVVVSSAISGDL